MNKLIFYILILLIQSCVFVKGKTDVTITLKNLSNPKNSSSSLDFPFSKMTILAGDTLTFTTSNGVGPYTANTYSTGTFNSGTTAYSAPSSLAPYTFNMTVTDSNGLSGNTPVEIIGLTEKFKLEQIKTFGDQNYPTSIVQSSDGSIYASTIFIDGSGWEDWGIWKSVDNGSNWTMVDKYLMYLYGEAHPLEIATKANDIYVCGYVWGSGGTPSTASSEWLVRKSSDGGLTWSNVDHWWGTTSDNVCYSIAVAPTGEIFTSGYSFNAGYVGIVRMSSDNGATWQEIGNFPGAGTNIATNVKVSPNGDLWVVVDNKLYKGVFSAGSWTWGDPNTISAGGLDFVAYEKQGELTIISDTRALFAGSLGANWKIFETVDAGVTWNEIHSRTGEGVSIKVLSTGEILSNGERKVSFSENYNETIKSSDDGSTFNLVMQEGALDLEQEGGFLLELINGDVLALGYRSKDSQAVVYRSTDKGDTWAQASVIVFYDHLYSEVSDYAEDSLGNIYTAGWVYFVDPSDPSTPYVIMKSSDSGATWTQTDYAKESGVDHFSDQVEVNILDNIFAVDYSYDVGMAQLRMSADQGASWSVVDSIVSTVSGYVLTTDTTGNIYYLIDLVLRRGNPDGTGFIDAATFPVVGGQTSVSVKSIDGMSDGSLLAVVLATEAATQYKIIYRSIDNGVTWSEVHRIVAAASWFKTKITEDSSGDYLMLLDYKIYRSSDSGTSWTEIYDASSGNASSIVVSNDDQVFFRTSEKIFYYSSNTLTWTEFWDVELALTPAIDSSIVDLYSCRFSPIGVCANIMDYTKYDGSVNYMWTAE